MISWMNFLICFQVLLLNLKKQNKTKKPNILAGDFNLHTDEPYCIFKYFFNIAKANMGIN